MILENMKIFINILIFSILISTNANAEFKSITKKEYLDRNLKALEKRFDLIDTNKDQKIDAKENEAWRQRIINARKAQAKKRAELAKKIDTNKDGKLSKEEIENFKKSQKTKK
jgi:predicted ATPase with chaperone activity